MNRLLLLPVAVLLCFFEARADEGEFSFVRYQADNGLSHNTVRCAVQDRYGFMWFGTADGLNRFDAHRFKVFKPGARDSSAPGSSSIYSLYEDDAGRLWVGTQSGAYLFDPVSERFSRFDVSTLDEVCVSGCVSSIIGDDNGKIWIGTKGQGIFIYDLTSGTLVQNSKHVSVVSIIHVGPDGRMFVGSQPGVIVVFASGGEYLSSYNGDKSDNTLRSRDVTAIHATGDSLWYGMSDTGLHLADMKTGRGAEDGYRIGGNRYDDSGLKAIYRYSSEEFLLGFDTGCYLFDISSGGARRIGGADATSSLSDQTVEHICNDREGGIWICTRYGGVNYIPRRLKYFESRTPEDVGNPLAGRVVGSICEDARGNIWIATEDGGISCMDAKSKLFRNYPSGGNGGDTFGCHNVQTLLPDGDRLWIGTRSRGLAVMDILSGRFTNHTHRRGDQNTIADNMVTALYRNSRGVLYVGTAWGLCRHVPDKDNFMPIPQVGNQAYISDIVEDSRGAMWFGSNNMGLFRYDSENGWHNFRYSASGSGGLPNDNVTTLFEDLDHRLWVGTEAGLCVFDPDSESFEAFDPDNTILSGQTICSVERDWRGYMWVSSSMGLSCIDVDRGLLINHFTQIDGLPTNQFNYRSSLKARDGKLYFGSISGLIEFYPGRFQTNNFVPPVLISGIQVNNRELRPGPPPDGLPGLEKTSFATDKIKLRSGQNTVAFDFAALSYQSPDKNMYACKLEGWDDDWTHEKQPRAVYSNLSPGKYTFMVRGANNDGVWSEPGASVSVTVLHPFYSSTSARIIYLLLVLAALYTTHVVITARQTRRMKEYAARKEREGNRFKIEFFTNLVHEIRTPLSLINLPLELIIKSGDGNPVTRGWLDTMNRNTQSLLNLVNQLLDLRKNEQAHYSLDAAPCNVSELTREVCSSFRAMAQIRGVALEVTTPQSPCIANVDGDAISKVVTNLLSNALKYATYRVGVHLRPVSGGGFSISVMDDGPGIDPTERKRIFEPFFQSWGGKAGTGIGLSLAMLLARKHSGSIRIEDTPMGGATFILEIPPLEDDFARSVPLHGYVVDYAASLPGSRPAAAADASGENTVLVVEDNRELRELIGSFLGRDYRVLTADNGRQAVKVLLSEQINIVVSDVMMPEMDGWQLCDFIKTDNCLCHIPVVQLTARTSHEDRLKGLELGADAYIEKPFSLEHLSAQILNLLENRRRLRESYGLSPDTGDAVMVATNKRDSQFIEKLNAEILKHIDRENFYIETLAESMFMSRSNFYRKIKSLFGMSPNRYLKDFRIRHAAKLLSDNSFDANDVYDRVGFSSPSYFSKCFRERFDVSPRDYAMNVSSKAL